MRPSAVRVLLDHCSLLPAPFSAKPLYQGQKLGVNCPGSSSGSGDGRRALCKISFYSKSIA